MNDSQINSLPKVSVIVPAYNDEKNIAALIELLLAQDYPKELLEIIIVDNNSTDQTRDIAAGYPVRMLQENQIQSSYAARNTGLKEATGQIIAFTDSDCLPDSRWVAEGVAALNKNAADLAGGRVSFTYSQKKTAAEIYDSVSSMQIEANIRDRSVAKTANLFVKSIVFDEVGIFPAHFKSGGDVHWTAMATTNGKKLVYAPAAIIHHPARKLKELLRKQLRVGGGDLCIWQNKKLTSLQITRRILGFLKPPKPGDIKKRLSRSEIKTHSLIKFYLIAYLCKITTLAGVLKAIL